MNESYSDTIRKDIQDVELIVEFLNDLTLHSLSQAMTLIHSFLQITKEDTTAEKLVEASISNPYFVSVASLI